MDVPQVLHDYVTRIYYKHGLVVASNPFRCMIAMFVLGFVCAFPGLALLEQDLPSPMTWSPGDGDQPPAW